MRVNWSSTKLRVLVGECPARSVRAICDRHGWGEMYIYTQPRENWHRSGFDNGAYRDWIKGKPFDEDRYLRALDIAMHQSYLPYMAVVPDLVGRGRESLEFSMRWLDRLPTGWPWYLALQDGMQVWEVEEVIHRFDGLFLGGTDAFKREARDWRNVASIHCRRFHFARAGTETKIKTAINIKADSIDSSFPLWTAERIRRMEYLVNDWQLTEPKLSRELSI